MKAETFNILVVDDNLKNIQVLINILLSSNYNVEYATNGNEALLWTQKEKFDIILLDIMMPEMDGYEVCSRIKKNPEFSDVPIIFLTARDDIDSITQGFNCGGVDYITKPFNSEELQARVKTQLELVKSKEKLKDNNRWLEKQVDIRTKELKRANDDLFEAKKELEIIDVTKNEFLQMISHEIRTPLNGIIGFTNLLEESDAPQSIKKYIQYLNLSVKRLEQFSLDVLDISELRLKGAKAFTNEDIDIISLCNECVSDLLEIANEKQIKINTYISNGGYTIYGDRRLNKKNLTNILGNAINYSPINKEIQIDFSIKESLIICKITDNGTGFTDKILKKPFEPFNLDHNQINEKIGLNLLFGKLLMDAQNGSISLGNNKNNGAYVVLEYPIKALV